MVNRHRESFNQRFHIHFEKYLKSNSSGVLFGLFYLKIAPTLMLSENGEIS